jgi:hypothetical protein
MRRLHLGVGLLGVVAFLATGQYMDRAQDHLRGMEDAQRLLFRSTHIYLLLTSLLNLNLGLYLTASLPGWRRWLQRLGSGLVLLAPVCAAVAFFIEPWLSGLERPYSQLTAFASFVGVLLHALGRLSWRQTSSSPPTPL